MSLLTRFGRALTLPALLAISLAGTPGTSHAATSTDVKAGLAEVGFATLPTFLDAATESITIKFPNELGGGKLTFGGTIDAEALQQKKFVFTTSDAKKLTWNDAFGMKFLDLKDVALNLSVEKGAFAISLDGMIGGAFKKAHQDRAIVIDLAVEDKKLTDFTLSLPDTKLSLHAIEGIKNLPGSSKLSIEAPTISMNAIGGKVNFLNETVDAVAFYEESKKDWNIGLRFEKALTLATLTGHKGGFLEHLGLPKMRVLISTKGANTPYSDLPLAVQNFFLAVEENLPSGNLELASGVNVIAHFDPAVAPTEVKNALKTLGLGNAVLEIDGTVEGMFGGEPAVELAVDIDAPGNHSFKFLKLKDAKAAFFIKLSKVEEALGFRSAVHMSQGHGKPDLEFDIDFELIEQQAVVEVRAAGAMKGDWIDAAGIKGFTLENPFLSAGINETGSFDVLIDGTVLIGKEKIRAAADMVFSPEALGLPTAVAFAGQLNKLPMSDLIAHATKAAKIKGSNNIKKMKAEFRDVAFAFMTPGATLPADLQEELNIEGEGMALKAALFVNNKELGKANGFASTEGVKFDGVIDPFHLGPLKLKEATLDIAAGPAIDPKFAMSGDIELFKGFEEKYVLDLEPSKFKFSSETKFGGAFDVLLEAESNGLSFNPSNDFAFDAELAANYSKLFREMVEGALKGLKEADHKMKKAEDDVKKAEKSVNSLKKKLADEKRKMEHDTKKAKADISKAQSKVDGLKKTISYNKKKAHDKRKSAKHNAKKLKLGKAARDEAEAVALEAAAKTEEAALKTAEAVLKAAKKASGVVAAKEAPKVAALGTELAGAEAGLKTAEGVLEAARGVNKGVEEAVKAVGKGLTALKINRLGVAGSIKGITTGGKQGKKPVLVIDVAIHGKRHVYRENLQTLKNGFKTLAKEMANEVAKEILKVFKKA